MENRKLNDNELEQVTGGWEPLYEPSLEIINYFETYKKLT